MVFPEKWDNFIAGLISESQNIVSEVIFSRLFITFLSEAKSIIYYSDGFFSMIFTLLLGSKGRCFTRLLTRFPGSLCLRFLTPDIHLVFLPLINAICSY